jgi:hypothetical protein
MSGKRRATIAQVKGRKDSSKKARQGPSPWATLHPHLLGCILQFYCKNRKCFEEGRHPCRCRLRINRHWRDVLQSRRDLFNPLVLVEIWNCNILPVVAKSEWLWERVEVIEDLRQEELVPLLAKLPKLRQLTLGPRLLRPASTSLQQSCPLLTRLTLSSSSSEHADGKIQFPLLTSLLSLEFCAAHGETFEHDLTDLAERVPNLTSLWLGRWASLGNIATTKPLALRYLFCDVLGVPEVRLANDFVEALEFCHPPLNPSPVSFATLKTDHPCKLREFRRLFPRARPAHLHVDNFYWSYAQTVVDTEIEDITALLCFADAHTLWPTRIKMDRRELPANITLRVHPSSDSRVVLVFVRDPADHRQLISQ